MFCNSCGATIDGQAAFCPSCGAQQAKDIQTVQTQPVRQALLDDMEKVYRVASECTPHYAAFNQWQSCIEGLSRRRYENKAWKTLLYVGLPFAIIFVPIAISMGAFAPGYLFMVLFLVAAWIVSVIAIKIGTKKKNEERVLADQKQMQNGLEQQRRIMDLINTVYGSSGIAGIFPQDYLYEEAVGQCYQYIKNLRADSIKEALNLYEENLHRVRLERIQTEQYSTLLRAEALQQQTASAATFAAVMSGLSFVRSFR